MLEFNVNLENLPKSFIDIPTVFIPLDRADIETLLAYYVAELENDKTLTKEQEERYKRIANNITQVIKEKFPDGAFVKLGSRSPKDSFNFYQEGPICKTGEQALARFSDSERTSDDLSCSLYKEYIPCYIAVRKFIKIEPWREFRVFVRDKRIVGISQYMYNDYYPQIHENKKAIEKAIFDRFEKEKNGLEQDNIIIDFIFNDDGSTTIIECNPFSPFTDPCLLSWEDYSFKVKNPEYKFQYNKEKPKDQRVSLDECLDVLLEDNGGDNIG